MATDFDKHNEPDDSVFPVNFDDDSNLDMYGVWVKKRPENENNPSGDNAELHSDLQIDDFKNDETIPVTKDKDEFDTVYLNGEPAENTGGQPDEGAPFMDLDGFDLNDSSVENTNSIVSDGFDTPETADNSFDISEEDLQNLPDFQPVTETPSETAEDGGAFTDGENNFESFDLDDFLVDGGEVAETEPETAAEEQDPIKLDLSFDEDYMENKESNAIDFENDGEFDDIPDELHIPEPSADGAEPAEAKTAASSDLETVYTSEFDDLINSFDNEPAPITIAEKPAAEDEEETGENIDLNISLDDEEGAASITEQNFNNAEDEDDNISIFEDMPPLSKEEAPQEPDESKNDDLIIENTIIEADNIDKIREENIKILNESEPKPDTDDDLSDLDSMLDDVMGVDGSSEKEDSSGSTPEAGSNFIAGEETKKQLSDIDNSIYFDDVEAVKDDLFDAPPTPEEPLSGVGKHSEPTAPAPQNDKATEMLMQIAGELSSIKAELANLKLEMADREEKLKSEIRQAVPFQKEEKAASEQKEQNGFFGDDDMDETIALTGDELNNILITADFTEENTGDNYEIPEILDTSQIAGTGENGAETNFENESSSDNLPDIEDIKTEHINPVTEDLSYLDTRPDSDTADDTEDLLEEEKPTEHPEDYIDMPDFDNENFEEPDLTDFNFNLDHAENGLNLPENQDITDEPETFRDFNLEETAGEDTARSEKNGFDSADFDLESETLSGGSFFEGMNDDTAEGLDAAFETGTMDGLTDFSGSDEDSFSDPEAFDAELASSGLNALAEPDGSVFMPSLSPEMPIDSSESGDSAGSTEETEAAADEAPETVDGGFNGFADSPETAGGFDTAFETDDVNEDSPESDMAGDTDGFSDPEAFDAELASSGLNALAEPDGSVFMPSLSPETPIDSSESGDSAGSIEETEADGDKENLTADSADEAESTAKPKSGGDLNSLIDSMEIANTDLANFLSGKPAAEPSNTDETGSPEDAAETADGFSDITENADVPDTADINESIPESGSADNSDMPSASSDTAVPETEVKAAQEPQEPLPSHLKNEIKSVLAYMDQLLESLPEEKIEEFAKSEYFDTYKRLFEELGIS